MCVAFWSLTHPDYALILCNNRDEYLSRQTQNAHWHSFNRDKVSIPQLEDIPCVLSGIDVVAGGTWFGINRTGKVALLTNITEPAIELRSSRGQLCSAYLLHDQYGLDVKLPQFIDELTTSDIRYAGFNMVLLSPHAELMSTAGSDDASVAVHYEIAIVSNYGGGNPIVQVPIVQDSCTCGGLSNGTLDGRDSFTGESGHYPWPKVAQGQELLSEIIDNSHGEEELVEEIFKLLRTKDRPLRTRHDFQHNIMVDSVDLGRVKEGPSFAASKGLSDGVKSLPITGEAKTLAMPTNYYATRLATVLLVRRNGEVLFIERDVWITKEDSTMEVLETAARDGKHERRFRFQLELDTESCE